MHEPANIEEVQAAVRELSHVRVRGGGTKPALSAEANLSLAKLSGVLEYEPTEYTFTALAGTPVREVRAMLAENNQQMPFDAPLADAGATLGGTVAAGLSGPARYRFGGVRDFLLGVRFVNGEGDVVAGGGKVVKNAAGFDLPKLMVGALGTCGVMVSMTFKVFPIPERYTTLRVDLPDSDAALAAMHKLALSPAELACLDFEPPGRLWVRIGGLAAALEQRVARVQELIEQACERLGGEDEPAVWREQREFEWAPANHSLLKVPLTPGQIPQFEAMLQGLSQPVPRRYGVGGNLLWLAWPAEVAIEPLVELLHELHRPALAIRGTFEDVWIGPRTGEVFLRRLLRVLDPEGKFSRPAAQTA